MVIILLALLNVFNIELQITIYHMTWLLSNTAFTTTTATAAAIITIITTTIATTTKM